MHPDPHQLSVELEQQRCLVKSVVSTGAHVHEQNICAERLHGEEKVG